MSHFGNTVARRHDRKGHPESDREVMSKARPQVSVGAGQMCGDASRVTGSQSAGRAWKPPPQSVASARRIALTERCELLTHQCVVRPEPDLVLVDVADPKATASVE